MGVVDEDAKGLTALDTFQTPGYLLHRFQAANDGGQIEAVAKANRGCRQAVVDVLVSDDMCAYGNRVGAGGDQEGLLARQSFDRWP